MNAWPRSSNGLARDPERFLADTRRWRDLATVVVDPALDDYTAELALEEDGEPVLTVDPKTHEEMWT